VRERPPMCPPVQADLCESLPERKHRPKLHDMQATPTAASQRSAANCAELALGLACRNRSRVRSSAAWSLRACPFLRLRLMVSCARGTFGPVAALSEHACCVQPV
jgi:hypothetical protein